MSIYRITIDNIESSDAEKLRRIIKTIYPGSAVAKEKWIHDTKVPEALDYKYQHKLDIEEAIFSQPNEIQKTFYCLFMPLGIYCAFGASNIYHAYNKALKQWGARVYLDQMNTAYHKGDAERLYRISVYSSTNFIHEALKEVKQTTMTKLVKVWRGYN